MKSKETEIAELDAQIEALQNQLERPLEIAGPFVESLPNQGDNPIIKKIIELNQKKYLKEQS